MSKSTTSNSAANSAVGAVGYQPGFGNHFSTEAVPGALPEGQNSPQQANYGLYAELLSGTAFTASRAENRRTWTYRIRPSAVHKPFVRTGNGLLRSAPFDEVEATPTQLRWNPFEISDEPADFVDGLKTIGGNGDVAAQVGLAVHVYGVNRSMFRTALTNADGEMLIVPQQGTLRLVTELGILDVAPHEIGLIPRGLRFRVEILDKSARGYVCENYGPMLRLPELGPIGSNGLANPRDFLAPVAQFEDREEPYELVTKFAGNLWTAETDRSPFDVVAWHGNLAPCKYNLGNFMAIGSISFDHPDPSIYTVLTALSLDFVIFPPRWLVAENTFRPPWYHRNVMSEFMGLVSGVYDAKAQGFLPGGGSLHNCWSAHGPDAETYERASTAELRPHKIEGSLAFMFESRLIIKPTKFAMEAKELQPDYYECWQGLRRRFKTEP